MKIDWKKLIIIMLVTFVVGSFFTFFTMNNMDIYNELTKPFNVPSIIFPIVWSLLYLLMSISCYIICKSNTTKKYNAIILYGVQLVINSLWSLIFFEFGAYLFSFIWILLLFIVVVIMIIYFYKINKKAGLLQIPYSLWLVFAAILNVMIYLFNK